MVSSGAIKTKNTISHDIHTPKIGHAIGKGIARRDGAAKVCGDALYVADLSKVGVLPGATIRSNVAHGRLRAIDIPKNLAEKGIVVVTAADIIGENVVTLIESDQPILVPIGGLIKHPDEPLALVSAPTTQLLEAAVSAIKIEVEPFSGVHSLSEARQNKINLGLPDNLISDISVNKGDTEAWQRAFTEAHKIIESRYLTSAQEQMYIEPNGLRAEWVDKKGKQQLIVQGSMQCPYYIHAALKTAFLLEDDDISVQQSVTGGGFGGKEDYPSILAVHVALLAKKADTPVQIIYERDEDIRATTKRHPAEIRYRSAFNKKGELVAIDVEIDLDGGAYITLTPVVLSRAVLHASGPYRCPLVRIRGRAYLTNTPPHGAFRGFGAPQVTFAYERQMDKAAYAFGSEPLKFRRLNMLRLGDETATQQTLGYSVASERVLQAVETAIKKTAKPLPTSMNQNLAKPLTGKGLAFYFHGAGFTGRGEDRLKGKVSVVLSKEGRFEVRSASTDIGQGQITIFTQIAADALKLPLSAVHIPRPDTEMVPDSGPTVASRTCMVVGSIVAEAATRLHRHLQEFAKERGYLDTGDETNSSNTISTAEIAEHYINQDAHKGEDVIFTSTYHSPPGISFDDKKYIGDAYPVFGWAACHAEVSIDPYTFEVNVQRLIHAVDVGKAINPVIVKGQIEGGTLQSLGWALWESVLYKEGRVQNDRMTSSIIPTAIEAPEMETIIVEDPYPHGPQGAKGVGELPMDGPAAAIANAIADAMGQAISPDKLPLLPETLFELAEEKTYRPWLFSLNGKKKEQN